MWCDTVESTTLYSKSSAWGLLGPFLKWSHLDLFTTMHVCVCVRMASFLDIVSMVWYRDGDRRIFWRWCVFFKTVILLRLNLTHEIYSTHYLRHQNILRTISILHILPPVRCSVNAFIVVEQMMVGHNLVHIISHIPKTLSGVKVSINVWNWFLMLPEPLFHRNNQMNSPIWLNP